MHSIRRSGQLAIRSIQAAPLVYACPRRAFTQGSVLHAGALPVFLESSTPELSAMLSKLNSKLLLPAHLTIEQQKLVYRQANKAKLKAEPMEITLGEVTLPLQHLDQKRDLPNRQRHVRELIEQSTTRNDLENVLRAFEGFENAGVQVSESWQRRMVAQLGKHNMQHLIIKALRRPEATGMTLKHSSVTLRVLRVLRDRPILADWDKTEMQKALGWIEQVVELMEEEAHQDKSYGEVFLRTRPEVVAVPLEMAAELAYRHNGDTSKVAKYAARLMYALERHEFLQPVLKEFDDLCNEHAAFDEGRAGKYTPFQMAKNISHKAAMMGWLIPVWNALSTARTVLEDKMPMAAEAERVQKELRAGLQRGLETLERNDSGFKPRSSTADYVRDMIKRCEA